MNGVDVDRHVQTGEDYIDTTHISWNANRKLLAALVAQLPSMCPDMGW